MAVWNPEANEIFLRALEVLPPEARRTFLDDACRADRLLREQVESLLAANEQAGSFLEAPAPNLVATAEEPVRERPGTLIGPYKLMEQIGEGGMGLVFVAEQQQPVRRKVALKVIKPGMDTREVIARFEAERQALALMDHPNIARVLDAGATDSGRPYFVMGLVRGVPIGQYQFQCAGLCRWRVGHDQHRHERGLLGRAPLKHSPPVVEAGGSQAASVTERPHAQPARPPLGDPAPPLPFLPLVPCSARGHDGALLSEGLHHGRQERDPPDGHRGR
jgi:hypothetical protein